MLLGDPANTVLQCNVRS